MSIKQDLQKAIIYGNRKIVEKGGSGQASTIRGVLNNIDTVFSSGAGYTTLDIPKYITDKLLEALQTNKEDGYIAGILHCFEAIDQNKTIERGSSGFFTGKMKYIYSDGYEDTWPHTMTFDTNRDIITPMGNYRYRIVLIKEPWNPVAEPPTPPGHLQAINIRYIISYGTHVTGNYMTEFIGLRELSLINLKVYPEKERYNYSFRGRDPEVLDGMDFTNSWFSFPNTTKFRNLSNITGNVSLSVYNYGIDKESIMCILNALLTVSEGTTYTVKFSSQVIKLLSEEEIAIATGKGYVVSNS